MRKVFVYQAGIERVGTQDYLELEFELGMLHPWPILSKVPFALNSQHTRH